jgi:hypothetical protein
MSWAQRLIRWLLRSRGQWSLRSMILTLCANDREILDKIDVDTVVERIEDYLAGLPLAYFLGVKGVMLLVEFAIPPISPKLLPMSFMPLEKRIKYVESWADSRFSWKRMSIYALKFVCLKQIYSEPALLQAIGYGPALQERTQGKCSSMARP